MFWGGIIFNFIGALARWIYGTIWRTIANRKKFSFREYLNGPEDSDDWFDFTGHQFVNKLVGMSVLTLFVWLTIKFGL